MPPVLNPSESKVDGLAFIGLSLQRHHPQGHPDSVTHQTAWDLNQVLDREYKHVFSTNDDGWLVGGGEPGPPVSYKLAAPDSAHVEIIRLGTFRPEWGGVDRKDLLERLRSGTILIPQMTVLPTAVVANPDLPPEVEIRFDMDDSLVTPDLLDPSTPLPVNWQLRFVHNQFFMQFAFASRFCPGPFHSTICRKVEWRSEADRVAYFAKCEAAIQKWKLAGPQDLVPESDMNVDPKTGKVIQNIQCNNSSDEGPSYDSQVGSGLWLFVDRTTISHRIWPNFHPPYNTPAKRKLIYKVLSQRWDEPTLSWKRLNASKEIAIQTDTEEKKEDMWSSWTDKFTDAFCSANNSA